MYIGLLEDDPHIARDVRDLLEGAGHKVRDFDNGGEMISALSRDTLDLFVLDWWVPEKTGVQVLGRIRGTLGLTTPVLFLTSRSDEKDIVAALNAGADDYCTKPIQSQVLLARIPARGRLPKAGTQWSSSLNDRCAAQRHRFSEVARPTGQ